MSALPNPRETDYDYHHAGASSSRSSGSPARAAILFVAGWFTTAFVHLHLRFCDASPRYYSTWLYRDVAPRNSRPEHDAVEHAGRCLAAGNRLWLDERDRRSPAGSDQYCRGCDREDFGGHPASDDCRSGGPAVGVAANGSTYKPRTSRRISTNAGGDPVQLVVCRLWDGGSDARRTTTDRPGVQCAVGADDFLRVRLLS